MDAALKSHFVPALRERGFAGALPASPPQAPGAPRFLNLQFYSAGGSFAINMAGPARTASSPAPGASAVDEIETGHILDDRRRITPRRRRAGRAGGEFWEFGPRSYDDPRPPEPQEYYDAIAQEALERLVSDGEPWFAAPGARRARRREQSRLRAGSPAIRCLCRASLGRRGCAGRPCGSASFWAGSTGAVALGALAGDRPRMDSWSPCCRARSRSAPARALRTATWDLPFGRMNWGEAGNRKWTTKYIEDGPRAGLFRPDRILVAGP